MTTGRRLACVLMLALGLAGSAGAADAVAETPLVSATILSSAGAVQDSVTVSALAADAQHCPEYSGPGIEEHGRQAPFTYDPPTLSWAVAAILGCLHNPVALDEVTAVTIINRDGSAQTNSSSQLTPDDLRSPSDFINSAQSPIIESLGSTFQYDRPWRGGSDNNFFDEVQMPTGSPVTIEVFEGPSLTVKASASSTTVQPGGSVSFSAAVVAPPNAAGLSYNWNFDGAQAPSSSSNPSVTFGQQGVYDVGVQVSDAAGGSGFDTIPITVGQAAAGPAPGSQSTPTGTATAPSQTPTRGGPGGGGPGGGNRHGHQHHRNGKSSTGQSSHPTKPSGSTGSQSTTGSQSSTGSHSSTGSQSTSGSQSSTGSHSSSGSQGTSGSTTSTSTPATHAAGHGLGDAGARRSSVQTRPRPTTNPSGALVTGRLISDVIPIPAGASPLVHPAPAAAASASPARVEAHPSLPAILAGVLTIVLLLSFGAARELRSRRDWRALRFGS